MGLPDRAMDICQMAGKDALLASVNRHHKTPVPAWDAIKDDLMRYLISIKFSSDPQARSSLVESRGRLLVEATGHPYWAGAENRLGIYLMERREIILYGLPEVVPAHSWSPSVDFLHQVAMRCPERVGEQVFSYLPPLVPSSLRAPVPVPTTASGLQVASVSRPTVTSTVGSSTTASGLTEASTSAASAAVVSTPAVSGGVSTPPGIGRPLELLLHQGSTLSPPALDRSLDLDQFDMGSEVMEIGQAEEDLLLQLSPLPAGEDAVTKF